MKFMSCSNDKKTCFHECCSAGYAILFLAKTYANACTSCLISAISLVYLSSLL